MRRAAWLFLPALASITIVTTLRGQSRERNERRAPNEQRVRPEQREKPHGVGLGDHKGDGPKAETPHENEPGAVVAPEPATLALVGTGLAALVAARRRRRST
jgi:hypothetical protein